MKQNNEKNVAERVVMKTPPIVSAEEWEATRQQLLVKENVCLIGPNDEVFDPEFSVC